MQLPLTVASSDCHSPTPHTHTQLLVVTSAHVRCYIAFEATVPTPCLSSIPACAAFFDSKQLCLDTSQHNTVDIWFRSIVYSLLMTCANYVEAPQIAPYHQTLCKYSTPLHSTPCQIWGP